MYGIISYLGKKSLTKQQRITTMRVYFYNNEEAKIQILKAAGRFAIITDLEAKRTAIINTQTAPVWNDGKLIMFPLSENSEKDIIFAEVLDRPVEVGLNAYGADFFKLSDEDDQEKFSIKGKCTSISENKIVVGGKSIPKAGIDFIYELDEEEETDDEDDVETRDYQAAK